MRLCLGRIREVQLSIHPLLLCCLLAGALAQPVVVTVATQNLQEMQALTEHIDAVASSTSEHGNATRVLLGAIEATMSRVVDSESTYFVAPTPTVPTMTLLEEVDFDPETRIWTFEYRSMVMLEGDLNEYKRILYVSKAGNMNKGDTQNPCLATEVSAAQCVADLKTTYYVDPAASAASDSLGLGAVFEGCEACSIGVSVQPAENSVEQRIVLTIPHATVRGFLAKTETQNSVVWGEQRLYTFGIGMLFAGRGKHVVISDKFSIVENSIEQVALTKFNTYSVAKHMSFWSSQAVNTAINIVTFEYLLEQGQELEKVDVSMNGVAVPQELCDAKDRAIAQLAEPTCLTKSKLCSPSIYTTGSGADVQTWVSAVYPVPDLLTMPLAVNTLLTTRDMTTNRTILSTVNFQTHHVPQQACRDVVSKTFSPVEYVDVDVYRGSALQADILSLNEAITVHNNSVLQDSSNSKGMVEALLTLVFHPKDAAASAYFAEQTTDSIQLDHVYMSHAKVRSGVIPDTIKNNVVSDANGRSDLQLDALLLERCPHRIPGLEASCVTTHDWTQAGGVEREQARFVYEVRGGSAAESDALTWLASNVLGSSTEGINAANVIYSRALAKIQDAHTKVFWILPLYHWPDESPLGLKDTTIISLAWSVAPVVAPAAAAPPAGGRRLLEAEGMTQEALTHAADKITLITTPPPLGLNDSLPAVRPPRKPEIVPEIAPEIAPEIVPETTIEEPPPQVTNHSLPAVTPPRKPMIAIDAPPQVTNHSLPALPPPRKPTVGAQTPLDLKRSTALRSPPGAGTRRTVAGMYTVPPSAPSKTLQTTLPRHPGVDFRRRDRAWPAQGQKSIL